MHNEEVICSAYGLEAMKVLDS